MEPSEATEALWEDQFTRTYPIWGKQVTLRSLHNPEVLAVNRLVAKADETDRMQALAVLTVASALVSIDGKPFGVDGDGKPLPLEERARIIGGDGVNTPGWHDALTAAIQKKYTALVAELSDIIEGITAPNSSRGPEATIGS